MDNPYKHNWHLVEKLPSEIRWFGDQSLRTTCQPLTDTEIEGGVAKDIVQRLVDILKETNVLLGLGRAIAANQIGIHRRVFVTFDSRNGKHEAFLNPTILSKSPDKGKYMEMCLSGLPLLGEVIRSWEIEIEYMDQNGVQKKFSLDPTLSRIVQHEIDHLDGILFIDRINSKSLSFEFDWEKYKNQNHLVKV